MPADSPTEVQGRASLAVPAGAKVVVDEQSWQPDGARGGLMKVTVTPPGGSPTSYAAVVVNVDGSWKILATIPLGIAPTTTVATS